jgi:hypothetical protein
MSTAGKPQFHFPFVNSFRGYWLPLTIEYPIDRTAGAFQAGRGFREVGRKGNVRIFQRPHDVGLARHDHVTAAAHFTLAFRHDLFLSDYRCFHVSPFVCGYWLLPAPLSGIASRLPVAAHCRRTLSAPSLSPNAVSSR